MIWLGHIGGIEGDEEGLVDVLVKLETSLDEVFTPCDVAARNEETRNHVINFIQYMMKIFVVEATADSATNSITFTLSNFDKPLSFDLDVFLTIIGLKHSKDFDLTPPKETVKAGLATLGLIDENDTSLSSADLINSLHFKPTLEDEVPLTAHMCTGANLLPEPIKSLIPPSGEVNVDDNTDKSSSGTSVQPVTQPKAPTDLKPKKKRI
ncbi:hypothetical protein Tco_0730488 [Tanacetum coccineum]|uniref:Uncharacterized protein n=1 Tax=Tanacetum coccineum TaxID=301880 RepID=A0ABQ4YUQ1_9ASTR